MEVMNEKVNSADSDFLVFDIKSNYKEYENHASKIAEENSNEDGHGWKNL
jgi:hypothetical protein